MIDIWVKAKPSAKEERIEQVDANHFVIAVREPPVQGRANAALAQVLADHFGVPLSNVRLVSGFRHKEKRFQVEV